MNGKVHNQNSPAIVVSVNMSPMLYISLINVYFLMIQIPDDFEGYPLESFRITPNLTKYLQTVLIPGGFLQDR